MWLAKSLNYFLIWFPVLALSLVFCFLVARRTYRELPYFFVYVLNALLIVAARYPAYFLSRKLYFYVYWVSELEAAVVVTLALYEVFLRRLFAKFHKVRFYRSFFAIVALVVLVLTILTALEAPDKGKAFLMASRAYDFVRTAILVVLVALMALMGRQWTRYDFGIALGFGVQAATALINAGVRTRMHYQPTLLDVLEAVSYNLSCLIWLITFWKPEKPRPVFSGEQLNAQVLEEARTWETTLKKWLVPGKTRQKGAGQVD